jgi:hypothetical protein
MPVKQRAKQFAMFDAMKGLTEAIAEKEKQICPKRELEQDRIEEINELLNRINIGDEITVEYYCQYGKKYKWLTGTVTKIDAFWKELQIEESSVSFKEIFNIRFT